jgi:hypothetical protein
MKCAVVTIAIGNFYGKLAKVTHPTIKAYAKKIGADFICWNDKGRWELPHYRKLDIKELKQYDRVLYVDTDIIVRSDSPNLFDIVPEDSIGMLNEAAFIDRKPHFFDFCRSVNYPLKDWNGKYYNTGVMVLSKQHLDSLFENPPQEVNHFFEQSYLNLMTIYKNIKMYDLSFKFNRMTCMEGVVGESRLASYFVHYANVANSMGEDTGLTLIKKDLKEWKNKKGVFNYKKKICIQLGGGLGDVVASEPTVRYTINKTYPNEEIIIVSNWPELFNHLGRESVKFGHVVPNAAEYAVIGTPHSADRPYFNYVSPLLSHQLTIASHLTLRRELPISERDIKISLTQEEYDSAKEKFADLPNDLILVHPGKHWQSKTFPSEIWQNYIDMLIKQGLNVAVIGKTVDDKQGVVDVDSSRCINLVDKTSIKDMLYLMKYKANVLLSNDSSPIHLAGATDINIALIPTCKHPDYILPWRNGSIYYKTKAIFKKPLWEIFPSDPLQMEQVMADKCDPQMLIDCLPSGEDVLNAVRDF